MKSLMKNGLLGLWIILFIHLDAAGSNFMAISSTSTGPGQNFTVSVDINNSDQFVAFQFDLPLPAGFSFITGTAALNPLRINGHALDVSVIPGNKLRVLGYSSTNVPFTGNTGAIVSFQLTSGTVPGSYPLTLVAPVIGDTNSTNILTGSTNGMATLLAPDINIPETLVDFLRTPLGSTTDKTLTIYNTGNQPLNITEITFSSPYFAVVGSSVFSIPAGQNYNLVIRFTSVVKGEYNKKITITCDDPDEAIQQVNLHARAYAVNELHTGNIFAYSGKTGTLTFSINNMEPFTGFQFDLALPSSLTYIANSALLTNRKSNHTISVNTVPGNKLRVVAHSSTGATFTGISGEILSLSFQVKGIGGNYPLNLQSVIIGDTTAQNSLSDSYNGTLSIAASDISSAGQLGFGNVSVLQSPQKSLRIYNYGTDTLKIEQITLNNPSYSIIPPAPSFILSSNFADLNIAFHQATRGQSDSQMKIFSNDPDEYPYLVNLSAHAYVPNNISIPNLTARNIDTVTVPVKITNLDAIVGFQVDIDIPDYLAYVLNSATPGQRSQGHLVVAQSISANRVRLISYSPLQDPFTGDTGTVATLKFAINATNNQTTALLTLSNGVLGNALSQDVLWNMTNGSILIEHPKTLSGSFTYNNPGNTPLDSLWVFLKQNGLKVDSIRTTGSGFYQFPAVYNGAYTIAARTNKPWAGVNATDGLKVMRHFVGLENLTLPIRKTAADVNNTGVINGTDASNLQLRCAGVNSSFERGDWSFEKHGGGDTVIIAGVNQNVNFYGLCVGDVNGSHTPLPGAKSTFKMEINTDKVISAGPDQELYLPVTLQQDCVIGALTLIISFPGESFEVEGVTTVKSHPVFSAEQGILKVAWADLNPISALAGEPIAYIRIKTREMSSQGQLARFSNISELTEIADPNGEPFDGIQLSIPAVQITGESDDRQMFIAPNPARQYTSVFFRAAEKGTISLRLYNMQGVNVFSMDDIPALPGLNKTGLNVSSLARGEYLLDIEISGSAQSIHQSGKLIID